MGLDPYQLVTVTLRATTGGGTSDRSNELSGRSSEAGTQPLCYMVAVNNRDHQPLCFPP